MRRLGLVFGLLVFFLSSCSGYPPMVSDDPRGIPSGGTPGRPPATNQQSGCHEVQRVKCAVNDCKGPNMDYVMVRCQDGREINRCVMNSNCG
jgi:hypothetical protein